MAEERPQPSEPVAPASPVVNAGGIFLALAALYFGRDIFVPFALAILLAFALAPLVDWLRSFKVPRIAAVLVAVLFAVLIIGGVPLLVGGQLIDSHRASRATRKRYRPSSARSVPTASARPPSRK